MATVDTRQLAALSLRLKKSTTPAQQARFYERTCRILAALFLRKVIKRTPVGDGQFEAIRENDAPIPSTRRANARESRSSSVSPMVAHSVVAGLREKMPTPWLLLVP